MPHEKKESRDRMPHEKEKSYIAIDLKSFYASVECVERGLDPLKNNLVVADRSRTEKTICLAVSPSLKAYGIPGRPRLFEVDQAAERINELRLKALKHLRGRDAEFTGSSVNADELAADPALRLDFVTAPPRMQYYMNYSADIFNIYQTYVAAEDIHVYSVDEVFMDVTPYLKIYKKTPHELAMTMIRDVLSQTGITATAGIGTNLYLAKIAMDIVAKKMPADKDGVRIAELDERSYRELLWDHRPLTAFWRVGPGIARKLESHGLYTMGDVARCSLGKDSDYYNEDLLYRLFGINAELLIDHAWGWEPVEIKDIKAYRPESNSLSSGQVLSCAYTADKARNVMREMADALSLDLVEKGLTTNQIVLTIGFDISNLTDREIMAKYHGPITADYYGRKAPKHAHGTANLGKSTSSGRIIIDAATALYDEIVDPVLLVRRINICANNVVREAGTGLSSGMAWDENDSAVSGNAVSGRSGGGNTGGMSGTGGGEFEQLSIFNCSPEAIARSEKEAAELEGERRRQEAVLSIKRRFGKNAILRGMNYSEGATMRERNGQIGGHKA
ncbi:MAG: DNA methylase [Eubacteriales bacterium]|nr:DNA methylase [Eubacteriales bacterium]